MWQRHGVFEAAENQEELIHEGGARKEGRIKNAAASTPPPRVHVLLLTDTYTHPHVYYQSVLCLSQGTGTVMDPLLVLSRLNETNCYHLVCRTVLVGG